MKIMFPIGDNPVKLKREDQDTLVKESVDNWKNYTDQWTDWLNRALESSNLYCDNRPSAKEKAFENPQRTGRSNVRLPVISQAVDAVVAQQHLANFPQDESFFKLRPMNDPANSILAAVEQHIEDSFEYIDLMAMSQKDRKALALAGAVAVWHPWVFCKETEYEYKQREILGIAFGTPKRTPTEVTKFEGTAFIPLHAEDVRFDATVDTVRDTNVTFRRWMDKNDLKKIKGLQNLTDLSVYYDFHDESSARKREYYQDWGIDPQFSDVSCKTAKEKVLLYEEWGDFSIGEKVFENHVLIYSNERVFHYFGPNPHDHQMKPLSLCPYMFMPGSLLGKSMAHDIIPLAHQLNTSINQANDIFSITGNPAYTYLYNDPGLVELAKHGPLVTRPGQWIPVGSHDALQPVQHDRQAVGEIMNLYNLMKQEIRESTGGVPYATGGASEMEAERTLGEVEILASGTSTRFQLTVQTYDEMRLKPFAKISVSNLRQYATEPITPIDGDPVTPDMLKEAKFDVNITGSKSVMSRKKDFDDWMFILSKLQELKDAGLVVMDGSIMKIKGPAMFEEVLKMTAAKNLPDLYEIITPEQQQEEMQEGGFGELAAIQGLNPGAAPLDMVAAQGAGGMAIAPPGGY